MQWSCQSPSKIVSYFIPLFWLCALFSFFSSLIRHLEITLAAFGNFTFNAPTTSAPPAFGTPAAAPAFGAPTAAPQQTAGFGAPSAFGQSTFGAPSMQSKQNCDLDLLFVAVN